MAKKTQVALAVELTEKEIQAITGMVDGEAPPAAKISAFVAQVLSAMAQGSMLLSADTVDQIREIDPELDNPEAIVAAIGQGKGIVDGEMVIRWPTDPALMQVLKERADTQGQTVQQLLKDMMDTGTALGWYWDVSTQVRTIFFSHEEAAEVGKAVGKEDFTSADLMEFIQANAPEEEMLFIDEDNQVSV